MSDNIDNLNRRAAAYEEACFRVRAAYDSLIDAYTVPGVALPGVLDAAELVLSVLENATSAAERVLKLRDEFLLKPAEPTVPAAKIRELAEWHETNAEWNQSALQAAFASGHDGSASHLRKMLHTDAARHLRAILDDDQDGGDA